MASLIYAGGQELKQFYKRTVTKIGDQEKTNGSGVSEGSSFFNLCISLWGSHLWKKLVLNPSGPQQLYNENGVIL